MIDERDKARELAAAIRGNGKGASCRCCWKGVHPGERMSRPTRWSRAEELGACLLILAALAVALFL